MAEREKIIIDEFESSTTLRSRIVLKDGIRCIGDGEPGIIATASEDDEGVDGFHLAVLFLDENDEEVRVELDDCLSFSGLQGVLFSPRAIADARTEAGEEKFVVTASGLMETYLARAATLTVQLGSEAGFEFIFSLPSEDFVTTATVTEGLEKLFVEDIEVELEEQDE